MISLPHPYFHAHLENLAAVVRAEVNYVAVACRPGPYLPAECEAVLAYAGQLLQQKRCHRLLLDQREMAPLNEAERTRITAFWTQFAQCLASPLLVAYLPPHNVFARLASTQARGELRPSRLTFCSFDTAAAAVAWLQAGAA